MISSCQPCKWAKLMAPLFELLRIVHCKTLDPWVQLEASKWLTVAYMQTCHVLKYVGKGGPCIAHVISHFHGITFCLLNFCM